MHVTHDEITELQPELTSKAATTGSAMNASKTITSEPPSTSKATTTSSAVKTSKPTMPEPPSKATTNQLTKQTKTTLKDMTTTSGSNNIGGRFLKSRTVLHFGMAFFYMMLK